jgi:hypothetical protein
LAGTGIRRNPDESGVNTGIPVPQDFLQKIPVTAAKNRNSCNHLQNHIPVKNSFRKHRKKRNPQESWQEQLFCSKKLIPENKNMQPWIEKPQN